MGGTRTTARWINQVFLFKVQVGLFFRKQGRTPGAKLVACFHDTLVYQHVCTQTRCSNVLMLFIAYQNQVNCNNDCILAMAKPSFCLVCLETCCSRYSQIQWSYFENSFEKSMKQQICAACCVNAFLFSSLSTTKDKKNMQMYYLHTQFFSDFLLFFQKNVKQSPDN